MSVFAEKKIGPAFEAGVIRTFAERIVEWGLDSVAYSPTSRSVGKEGA